MKEVLLITDVCFWEVNSGNKARISTLINYLSQHFNLTIVFTGPLKKGKDYSLPKCYPATLVILEPKNYLSSNGYGRKLKVFLKDRHFDAVIIEYIHCSYFLNFLNENCQVILDTHDLISERTSEFKKFNYYGALYEMTSEQEAAIFDLYDNVIMISQPDFEKASLMTEPSKLIKCPHSVPLYRHSNHSKVQNLTFIASAYLPNVDGINAFIQNCWDELCSKYHLELHIYGTVCEVLSFKQNKNIILHGFVSDLNAAYDAADIVLNPVRFGAGLKIKNIEALAHCKPLVTTTHGRNGIEAGAGKAYMIADTPSEFLSKLSLLIEDEGLRRKLSRNARSYIRDTFSPDVCFLPLVNAINNY